MNKTILILLAFSFCLPVSAQDTSSFWPHHLGDMWEYFYMDVASAETLRLNIIFDSTAENGFSYVKAYQRFISTPPHPWSSSTVYYVVDTLQQVFESYRGWHDTIDTRKIYKLDAELNEWWYIRPGGITAWVREIYQDTVFGVQTTVKMIVQYLGDTTGILMREDYLSDRFGLILQGGGDSGYWMWLTGALINGKLFGDTTIVDVNDVTLGQQAQTFQLFQNFPNPFNSSTLIRYYLPKRGHVSLKVYNILGQEVAQLVDAIQEPGQYQVGFEANYLASGMYTYILRAGALITSRRMIIIK